MKTGNILISLIGILGILLASCSSQPAPTPVSLPPTPTTQPTATPTPPTLWVAPYVPTELVQSVVLPDGWSRSDTAESATARLEIGDQNILSHWVYALVAPYPTVTDDVPAQDVKSAWQGTPPATFGSRLLMDQNIRDVFAAWWGEPAASAVTVLPADQLVTTAWDDMTSWAIVPFEQIEPRWKVLSIDGNSPTRKDFDVNTYALSVHFSLSSGSLSLLPSNRDPNKLTIVVTTGTTALVRGTAVMMEEKGLLYPAEEIAPILQNADITHISNEIPFWQDCPRPFLGQENLVFCSNPKYIQLLEYIGMDVVELTGDHFNDYGPDAMRLTLQMYRQRGWKYYGGGENLQEGLSPATFTHNGNKIAFLGCNAKGDGYASATDTHPGAAACGYDTLHTEIAQLKQEGYVVIATFQHQEYFQYTVLPEYRLDFTGMVDAGADIVQGSQAHQPQNFEFYKNGFIHYGTGNLFFDQYITLGSDQTFLDRAFIDRHVIYNGKYINTELLTIKFTDFAQSRFMTPEERADFLRLMFSASGWEAVR
ncbi:MAG: CapA family protein [Chloroflexi bacterium]|nr:CapA family protein [Chloroflexota bacterium]